MVLCAAAALRAAAAAAAFDPGLAFDKFPVLARRLVADGWLAREPFAYSPAYIYFLAALMRLGASPGWICAVQVALGVGACALVGALGRRLFGPTAGLVAAAGAAVFGPFLLYAIELESDGLGLFLYCAAALALLRALDRPSLRRFAIAGLLLGLRAVQRPDALLILALVAGLLALGAAQRGTARRVALGSAAVFVAAALVPLLPIAWQNARASGEFIPVTSSGGWVFYTSHNGAATGLSYFPPPLARLLMDAPAGGADVALDRLDDRVSRRVASLAADRDLTPGEASRYWRREGLLSVERRGFARQSFLQVRKLFYMLHAYEAQDNLSLLVKEARLGRLTFLGMGILAPLAFVGLVLAFAPGAGPLRQHLPLLAFLLAPALSMSVFYVGSRFRLELAAMLLPLAGLALVRFAALIRAGRWPALLAAGAAAVILSVVLHLPDREIVRQERMRFIQLHTFLAERAQDQHTALAEFRRATSFAACPAEAEAAWRGLAQVESERGNAEAAESALRTSSGFLDDATLRRLAAMGDDPDAQWAVGRHLMLRGEMARAAEVLGDAARLAPDDPDILLARALAAFEAETAPPDRVAAWAEEALDAGLRFSPNAATGYLLAARCYQRLGLREQTEAAARAARRYQAFIESKMPHDRAGE